MPCQSVVVQCWLNRIIKIIWMWDNKTRDRCLQCNSCNIIWKLNDIITDNAFTRQKLADLVDSHRKLQKLQLLHTEWVSKGVSQMMTDCEILFLWWLFKLIQFRVYDVKLKLIHFIGNKTRRKSKVPKQAQQNQTRRSRVWFCWACFGTLDWAESYFLLTSWVVKTGHVRGTVEISIYNIWWKGGLRDLK